MMQPTPEQEPTLAAVPDAPVADHAEVVRELQAQIAELQAEVARRDAALAALGERLIPIEQAREAGAEDEREQREAAEHELRLLEQTKIYKFLLRPRNALFEYRRRRGTQR